MARKGSFHMYVGPMFSGKTKEMIRLAERRQIAARRGEVVLVFKWAKDQRYGGGRADLLHSADGKTSYEAVPVSSVDAMRAAVQESHANGTRVTFVGIDEAQFHEAEPLAAFVASLVDDIGCTVVAAGLDLTSERVCWPWITALVPQATSIKKLTAVCMRCGSEDAIWSHKRTAGGAQVDIGGADKYEALCRACWGRAVVPSAATTQKEEVRWTATDAEVAMIRAAFGPAPTAELRARRLAVLSDAYGPTAEIDASMPTLEPPARHISTDYTPDGTLYEEIDTMPDDMSY